MTEPKARAAVLIATCFYLSYIPVRLLGLARGPGGRWTGAGFVGTLVGLAALPLLPSDSRLYGAVLLAGILGACWASGEAEKALGNKDDSRIIIDEVVGYWTTVAFLPRSPACLLGGFLLFRFFDVVKLPPYRRLEDLPGGYGVVMDDVGAGVAANLLLQAGRWAGWL